MRGMYCEYVVCIVYGNVSMFTLLLVYLLQVSCVVNVVYCMCYPSCYPCVFPVVTWSVIHV